MAKNIFNVPPVWVQVYEDAPSKLKRQAVMRLAKRFIETEGLPQSAAVHQAWLLVKLTISMKNRIVHFSYWKTNGEVREAWGTRLSSRIGDSEKLEKAEQEMKKKKKKKNDTVIVYYDLGKQAFRSFRKSSIVEFEEEEKKYKKFLRKKR